MFVEVTLEKILKGEGGVVEESLPHTEKWQGQGKRNEKKKLTRQRFRETIQLNPEKEREENKEGDTKEV